MNNNNNNNNNNNKSLLYVRFLFLDSVFPSLPCLDEIEFRLDCDLLLLLSVSSEEGNDDSFCERASSMDSASLWDKCFRRPLFSSTLMSELLASGVTYMVVVAVSVTAVSSPPLPLLPPPPREITVAVAVAVAVVLCVAVEYAHAVLSVLLLLSLRIVVSAEGSRLRRLDMKGE